MVISPICIITDNLPSQLKETLGGIGDQRGGHEDKTTIEKRWLGFSVWRLLSLAMTVLQSGGRWRRVAVVTAVSRTSSAPARRSGMCYSSPQSAAARNPRITAPGRSG